MDKELAKLAQRLEATEAAMKERLMALYPKGSDVRVMLKHGQVNPTHATVLGYEATIYGGGVCVGISSARRRGTFVRTISVSDIVWARGYVFDPAA